jgi:hypothetical protein
VSEREATRERVRKTLNVRGGEGGAVAEEKSTRLHERGLRGNAETVRRIRSDIRVSRANLDVEVGLMLFQVNLKYLVFDALATIRLD